MRKAKMKRILLATFIALRVRHTRTANPCHFRLLGKDSIRYYNKVAIDEQVLKNIKIFKRDKKDSDGLFGRVNVSVLDGPFSLCILTLRLSVGFT